MSGDIGRGATREAIAFAVRIAAAKEKPRGFFHRDNTTYTMLFT